MKKVLVLVAALAFASCEKCDDQAIGCKTFDLGKEGESYEPIQTAEPGSGNGDPGMIYVENGRIIQQICFV